MRLHSRSSGSAAAPRCRGPEARSGHPRSGLAAAPSLARRHLAAGRHRSALAVPVRAASSSPSGTRSTTALATTSQGGTPEPQITEVEWFYTEAGQKDWVKAMELDTLTPDMPALLKEMGIRYDPEKLAAVLADKWPQVYGRALKITTLLGGWIAGVARDSVLGQLEANQRLRATQLRQLLSNLGPSFVKIGQALSARPDLLPKVYLDKLADLQDRLPSFPSEIAFTVIENELGRPIDEMFLELSEEPVAAASLGQVYKGVLRSTGEPVAVKVQRPGIGESIAVDMLLLRRLMSSIDRNGLPLIGVKQPLTPLVDEFAGRLFAELDYVTEGHNAEKFQKLYGHMPRVRTPGIKWDYTSRRVLTMEWIEGVKLTNKKAMEEAGLSVVDFVDVGIECTLRQLLEAGFFHADPHPGNLLATRSGDLVYLDFGMMSEAPQYARYAIMAHVVHLVNRDYLAMCEDYWKLEFLDRDVDPTPIAPALAAFFDDVLDQSVSQLNFKAIVDGLGEVLFRFPFHVPAYYALILRSLTVLEGLALQADPNYKLLARAYPYMARRLLTDPAPELRESFEELVLKDGQFRWNRLENLMREGSKSQDFDPSQLWLLAEWLLTPGAKGVRDSVVVEVARMVDAIAAGDLRERIVQRTGSFAIAEKLVPPQPQESEALSRATLLYRSVQQRIGPSSPAPAPAPALALAGASGAVAALPPSASSAAAPEGNAAAAAAGGSGREGAQSAAAGAAGPSGRGQAAAATAQQQQQQQQQGEASLASLLQVQGTGPFGLLTPGDVSVWVDRARGAAEQTVPRVAALLRAPGAADLAQTLSSQLARRFTARAIKLAFGMQQVLGGGGAAAGGGGK